MSLTSVTTTPSRPPLARLLSPPQALQMPPERMPVPPIPPKPVPGPGQGPGQDLPDEVNPEHPPEVGDPSLPGEHAPVRDPQPPLTVHVQG